MKMFFEIKFCLKCQGVRFMLPVLTFLASLASSRGTTLLDDSFSDGTRNNQGLPADAAWYVSSPASWTTGVHALTVTNGTSAVLGVTYFGLNSGAPVSLGIGDTLTATVSFIFNNVAAANGSQGFRLGIYDFADSALSPRWTTNDLTGNSVLGNGVKGYALFQNFGQIFNSASPMDLRSRSNLASTSLLGTTGDYKTLGAGPGNTNGFAGFTNTGQYSLQIALFRTNATDMFVTATWQNQAGGVLLSTTVLDTNAATFNFDGIALRPSSAASSATNMTITEVRVDMVGVGTAPAISLDPHDASAYTGQSAFFSVVSDGTAPLNYQWYFNTNQLLANATNSLLVLTSLQTADAGRYCVVVTNFFGAVTSALAKLSVTTPVAPTIVAQSQSQTVSPGANVIFSVSASGSTPFSYQWFFNTNTAIAGANDATLTLMGVQVVNGGMYSVVVNNLAGTAVSSNIGLAINTNAVAPIFTAQPASLIALAGDSVGFTATVSGTGPVFYQWFKNNTPVDGAVAATLNLTNVQNSDAGSYFLRASNSVGSVTSSEATLTITSGMSVPNTAYNLTGFGAGTTGGGLIVETDPAYRKVTNALDLANALVAAYKTAGAVKVIEITTNLDLGWNEVGPAVQALPSTPFRSHNPPQLHPRLLMTGVSLIDIKPRSGLTIFSANGAAIRHATFNFKSTGNILVRNLKFDEMWEWDEASKGNYDKNDWDFIDLGNGGSVTNIWVDHCTFTKSYDGVLDTKAGSSKITLSWCKYVGDDGAVNSNSWVRQQISVLESNRASYAFYNFLRNNGFSPEDIILIVQGHDKTHLAGANEFDPGNATLSMTFHHLWFNNAWDRCVPRLRAGNVHDYNIYVDDSLVLAAKAMRNSRAAAMSLGNQNTLNNTYNFNPPINGSISTENGAVLVEKSVYIDCLTPLRNNQADPSNPAYTGKIMALDTICQLSGAFFRGNNTDPAGAATLGPVQAPVVPFSWNLPGGVLPYGYTPDEPSQLKAMLAVGAGAGALNWNKTNWLLTAYAPTPPGIIAQPQSQVLSAHENATLIVAATGSAPLSYTWYFNTNAVLPGATNSTLSLADVQWTNAGKYSVVVSNGAGSVTSVLATLTVSNPATGFAAWQATQFMPGQLTDAGISGPGAMPLGDGVPNLVKYALGLPAFTSASNAFLTTLVFTNGSWSLLYRRPAGVTDVIYDPRTSTDLLTWSNAGMIQQWLGTDTNSLQLWRAMYSGASGSVRFFQLQLHQ